METYCDCHNDKPREVRVLPLGDEGGSNLIVCQLGHAKEIKFRRERNKELTDGNRFDLPKWEELQSYEV